MPGKPRLQIVFLGGTVLMLPSENGGIMPGVCGDSLLEDLPALRERMEVISVSPMNVPSSSLTLDQIVQVSNQINSALCQDVDGVVVVQGTDSIEETAFALDLLALTEKPIVVTGAMRGASAISADGLANLFAAATVAVCPEARGLGTLVVLNDEIHAARFVRKLHTSLLSAFGSPDAARIGTFVEGAPIFDLYPKPVKSIPLPEDSVDVPVALVKVFAGDDGRLMSHIAELGYKGVVIEALGAGHVPDACVNRIQALIDDNLLVVLSTRVPGGRVFESTYGYAGSEIDLLRRGAVPSGHFCSEKARILLSLVLRSGLPNPRKEFLERT